VKQNFLHFFIILSLIFIAIILSHKYNEDAFYLNDVYSYYSGISVKKLFILESFFMKKVNYKFFVNYKEYYIYSKHNLRLVEKIKREKIFSNDFSL